MSKNLPAERELPSLLDLHYDVETAFKNDKFNTLLNIPPPEKWVIKHPIITKEVPDPEKPRQKKKVPIEYLPIEKVELLMTRIFQEWRVEVLNIMAMFNSVTVTVRVHYLHPLTNQWLYHDGVGAVGVQLDKDTKDWDLSKIKQDAVMKALPAAKSYAIKDACDHFGKVFGRDLNRSNTIDFIPAYDKVDYTNKKELSDEIKSSIQLAETDEFLNQLWFNNKEYQSNPDFMRLINQRKGELTKSI